MKEISYKEFDKKFDSNEDITDYLDFSSSMKLEDFERLSTKTKQIDIEFPEWVVTCLDREAKKIGVTRQSIIKFWITERLREEQKYLLVERKTRQKAQEKGKRGQADLKDKTRA